MRISLIVAMSERRVIGRGGQLPWHMSADLKRFKRLTMGHPILMGRRTFESIGRLLPGRTTVIITRQRDYHVPGALVAHDLDEALQAASGDDEVFVIGGAEIYRLALPRITRIYATTVHADVEGDVYFPELPAENWALLEDARFPADDKNPYDYSFRVYDRVQATATVDHNVRNDH